MSQPNNEQFAPINQQMPVPQAQPARREAALFPDRQHFANLQGYIETVSAVPTATPRTMAQGMKMYVNGATLRLYIYDFTNGVWRYATLT